MKLASKTALVTGGGSGIGLAISQALAKEGVKVIISGRNVAKLEQAQQNNKGFEIEPCDITNEEQVKQLVTNVTEKYGGIDILINNAGMFGQIDYRDTSTTFEVQSHEIDVDLISPLRVTHHFLPMLRMRNEAAIVNVSSALAFVPLAMAPVYCATKAALHSWTQSFRQQMKSSGILVFELMPPLVDTPMTGDFKGQKMMKPEALARDFIKGLQSNTLEIKPGQSSQMKMMSRLAPSFIFNAVNKQFAQ